MALSDIRHRTGALFLVVAVGHIILISAQVNTRRGVPVLEAVVFGAFSEVQRVAAAVVGGVGAVWGRYVALRTAQAENEVLRQRVAALQVELQQERALAEQNARLRALVDLSAHVDLKTTGATVVAGSARPDVRTLTIDKGTGHGLVHNMSVLAPAGIVGRVVLTRPRTAKVQLLVDRNAAAAALVTRSRAGGIVVGIGEDLLRLEFVSPLADIEEGDEVVTSGLDGIYPKGLVIGHVVRVERAGSGFAGILVRPAVDFGTLEEVLVVLRPGPRPPEDEGAG